MHKDSLTLVYMHSDSLNLLYMHTDSLNHTNMLTNESNLAFMLMHPLNLESDDSCMRHLVLCLTCSHVHLATGSCIRNTVCEVTVAVAPANL